VDEGWSKGEKTPGTMKIIGKSRLALLIGQKKAEMSVDEGSPGEFAVLYTAGKGAGPG